MTRTLETIVVGGGIGGLAAAATLARAGQQVLLLEKSSRPGGRAASPALAGEPMNLGAHALYLGGPAERGLRRLGVRWSAYRPDGANAWASTRQSLAPIPASPWSLLRSPLLDWRAKAEVVGFLLRLGRAAPAPLAGSSAER